MSKEEEMLHGASEAVNNVQKPICNPAQVSLRVRGFAHLGDSQGHG